MLQRLFPKVIDNQFSGHPVALYVFFALTALTLWRSQHHLFAPDGGAQSIATIPLDSYSIGAASTIIGIFSLWGLSQLLLGLIYLIAALRYRAMIPLLYLLFVVEYVIRLGIGFAKPIETVGTAPGSIGNLIFIPLGLAMLALCLIPRRLKND